MRVDDVANGFVAGELPDLREELVRKRFHHRVDDQHAVVADRHRRIERAADDHPDVPLDMERVDLDVGEIRRRARLGTNRRGSQQRRNDDASRERAHHGAAAFLANSGSAVAAPPRTPSTDRWCFAANSSEASFVPGRWLGTTPFSRTTSSTDSHGYGSTMPLAVRRNPLLLTSGSVRYTGAVFM